MTQRQESAADELIRKNGNALALMTTGIGIMAILCHIESGTRRWSTPAWRDAMQLPGSPATWGIVLLIAGICLTIGAHRAVQSMWSTVGYWLAFAWFCAVFGVQFYTLIHDESGTANPTWLILWLYVAYLLRLRYRYEKRTRG